MSRDVRRRQFIRSGAIAGAAVLAGCTGGGDGGSGDGGGSADNGSSGGSNDSGYGGGANNGSSGNQSGGDGSSSDSPPTVALSIPSLEFTFFARMQEVFEQAKNQGTVASDSSFYDAGDSQSTQISNVETAISNDVAFLMISAITAEGVVNAINEANQNDIPVIAIDRNVAEGETVTYIASDNVQLGQRSTELCLNFMQESADMDTYSVV